MCEKEDNDEANKEKKENIIGFIIQEESGKVRRKLMTASSQIISLGSSLMLKLFATNPWKLSRDNVLDHPESFPFAWKQCSYLDFLCFQALHERILVPHEWSRFSNHNFILFCFLLIGC